MTENIELAEHSHSGAEIWVTDFSVEAAIEFQSKLFEKIEENPEKPIVINIASPGGDVDGLTMMLDMMDTVRSLGNPESFGLVTVAVGKAMSAGAILLSHGDVRVATPNSRLMLHQILGGTWGSVQDVNVEHAELNRINHNLLTILHKNCKFKGSLEDFKALIDRDTYLTPQAAKEIGVIDLIGYPKVVEFKVYDLLIANGENPEFLTGKKDGKIGRTNKTPTKKKS